MRDRSPVGLVLAALVALGTMACPGPDNPPPPNDAGDVTDVDTAVPADDGAMPGACPMVAFVTPQSGQVLGISDDADRNCSNGFRYNVQVATNAPQGTQLELLVNGTTRGMVMVNAPAVTFTNVSLDSMGMSTFAVRVAGRTETCATVAATVNCNVPRCQITAPDHSVLTLRDDTSGGMGFATDFAVTTDVEDGQEVTLEVSSVGTQRATVSGGMARFRNISLRPDGEYRARAQCTNRAGNTGMSAESTFVVDSTPPMLAVTRPMMGTTIGLSTDVNMTRPGNQFEVCATSDAAGQRLCATVSGAMPDDPAGCAMVTAGMPTCVQVTCPDGGAPFNVDVSTQDDRGNPARATITGLRCQSTLPSVRVVAPAPFAAAMPATILNAMRDADPAAAGLQADVVACTDRGMSTARLYINGATEPTGMPVMVAATEAGDPCAMLGMGFTGIARFPRVTLPQTFPVRDAPTSPAPTAPTVRVDVTDGSGDTGRSAPVVLYVDSEAPRLSLVTCDQILRPPTPGGTVTADIDLISDTYPVTVTFRHGTDMPTTQTVMTPTFPAGRSRLMGVRFLAGRTTITLTATDPAGNSATTAACTVTVANPPTLDFVTPTAGQRFSTAPATVTVTLRSDAPVGTAVTLTVGSAAPIMGAVAAGGTVTFSNVMLPEGDAVRLAATTADVAGRGVGTATITVVVDTGRPTPPMALMGVVPTTPASARRAGTIRLSWREGSDPAPGGGTRAVDRYEIRRSNAAITETNYAMAEVVSATVTPGAPGTANQLDLTGLRLGRPYFFAMRSIDVAGNPSATVATTGPVALDLIADRIAEPSLALGAQVSGGYDVNGDGLADVVVGSGTVGAAGTGVARIYFGSATGITATNYAEIRGSGGARFGSAAVSLGDLNGDGLGDVAIGEPGAPSPSIAGSVYVFFGRRTWRAPPLSYSAMEADVTLGGGTGEFIDARFGATLARVGDFNGDGLADLAAGALNARDGGATGTARGAVLVFFGRRTFPVLLTPANADVTIRNNSSTLTLFGRYLAGGGRLIGADTLEDLIIGGGSTAVATTFVYSGRRPATALSLTLADAAFTRGPESPETLGAGQIIGAGVGDINNDGFSDMAIGHFGAPPGVVFLYFGNASGGLTAGPRVASGSMAPGDVFGSSIASVWDPTQTRPALLQNRSPGADLLVGSNAFGGENPRLWIFQSRASAAWGTATTTNAEGHVQIPGTASEPMASATWVGDIDGDGFPDAAAGQPTGRGTLLIVH